MALILPILTSSCPHSQFTKHNPSDLTQSGSRRVLASHNEPIFHGVPSEPSQSPSSYYALGLRIRTHQQGPALRTEARAANHMLAGRA